MRIAISIVSWGHARFLPALFNSLDKMTYSKDLVKIFLLDNNSSDDTVAVARRELLDESALRTKGGFPAELIESDENLGFAGGHNFVIKKALKENFDFIFVLNPDTEVSPDVLEKLVAEANDKKIGCLQPLMLLHPETEKINSAGNTITYLGLSYCLGNREKRDSVQMQKLLVSRDIVSASGAVMFLSSTALRHVGAFDEQFFAYHEDVELSWRIRLAGMRIRFVPNAVVYHKYEFSRSIKKYYWMERNRYLVLLMCFRVPTLILIAPMLIILELSMWPFAILRGWWKEKLRVYKYLLNPRNLKETLASRKRNQDLRVVSDRMITKDFSTSVSYQEIDNPVLTYIGNPIMWLYWKIVYPLIRW